jgi:hypothetical protein
MSLRALMVLVLACGAGLAWLVRSARIQRDAVAAIENAGGSVAYEWRQINLRTPSDTKSTVVGSKPRREPSAISLLVAPCR